ncbi:MAG: thioesterase family protein [Cyanobacteria bacterium J06607_6]
MAPSPIAPPAAFAYPVRVQPHHTDYGGVVWHGTYITWMESARIEYLRSHDIDFANWVGCGVDLPVVDLSLQYHQPLRLGDEAVVLAWPQPRRGIRVVWQYQIQNQATQATCVTGVVTLVPVNTQQRKILRQLPEPIKSDFDRLYASVV